MSAGGTLEDAGIGELLGRLAEDGKRLAKAEVDVQVATVRAKAEDAMSGVILFVVALLLVIAAVVVLVFALGDLLARWIGPAGGHAVAAIIALILAGVLAKVGAGRVSAALSKVRP